MASQLHSARHRLDRLHRQLRRVPPELHPQPHRLPHRRPARHRGRQRALLPGLAPLLELAAFPRGTHCRLNCGSSTIASKRCRSVKPNRSYSLTASSLPSVTVSVMASKPASRRLFALRSSSPRPSPRPRYACATHNCVMCATFAPTREQSTMPTSALLRRSRSIQEKLASKMPHPGKRTMLCRNRSDPCSERYW